MKKFMISKSGVRVYKGYRDQVTIDKDNLALAKMAKYPYKKDQLRSENSEDIKSWNLFRALQLNNEIDRYYELIGIRDELENILICGLNVNNGVFDRPLQVVLNNIEPKKYWKIQQTEPDVIILGKRTVIFNESKLGKAGAKIDAWNRKDPFSDKHELYKKNATLYFKKKFIDSFDTEARRYYQLMRNYIVGTHYAEKIEKEFHLVALVSSQNLAKSGLSHKEEFEAFRSLLKDSSRCHILTWEQLKK